MNKGWAPEKLIKKVDGWAKGWLCYVRGEPWSFCCGGELLALVAADFIDVSFKVAVLQEPCDHILLEGGDGAGVEAEALVERLY